MSGISWSGHQEGAVIAQGGVHLDRADIGVVETTRQVVVRLVCHEVQGEGPGFESGKRAAPWGTSSPSARYES